MSRKSRVAIYLILIVLIIVGVIYFGGYHFSREACIEDSLRGMDGVDRHEVMVHSVKGKDFTLLMDDNDENAICIETKKLGFLHKIASVWKTNTDGNGKVPIKELAMARSDKTRVMFVRRIDKSIEQVRITIGEGEATTQQLEWKNDIASFSVELDDTESKVFVNMEFLDENGNMIFFTFTT